MLLLLGGVALLTRFWQLGELPPSLYRDEAFNGLDALGVLRGEYALFFPANNGREPAYIYLTALSVALLGRTAMAVRLAAAVVGTLTTWIVYQLGKTWFNRQVGWLVAWLWAVTVWTVHLSRIGLRPIMMIPMLTLAMWLGTLAWHRQSRALWLVAGAVYGLGFYTYLAMRFTPVLLVALIVYGYWRKRKSLLISENLRVWGWFGVGAGVMLLPLGVLAWKMPAFILSRTSQVSILNPEINGGNLLGTLLTQTGRALGMFFWQGDTILRHNPAGRPVFDPLMTIAFLVGVGWCLRHWRKPVVAVLFLWVGTMLSVTILAEDTPHFLRAVGILPAILFFPALGLSHIWQWEKMPAFPRQTLVIFIMGGSLLWGVYDYWQYGQQPDTAYLFEATNRELATQINLDAQNHSVLVQQRLWEDRPALDFFVQPSDNLGRFNSGGEFPNGLIPPVSVYTWATDSPANVWAGLKMPAHILTSQSSLVRGDLEPDPYPLYMRFDVQPLPPANTLARFGDHIQLQAAEATFPNEQTLQVDLDWRTTHALDANYVVFVHVVDETGLVAQSDEMPAFNTMPTTVWQTNWLVRDSHTISLPQPFDKNNHRIYIGLYLPENVTRLPAFSPENAPIGDNWQLPFTNKN